MFDDLFSGDIDDTGVDDSVNLEGAGDLDNAGLQDHIDIDHMGHAFTTGLDGMEQFGVEPIEYPIMEGSTIGAPDADFMDNIQYDEGHFEVLHETTPGLSESTLYEDHMKGSQVSFGSLPCTLTCKSDKVSRFDIGKNL